MYFDSFSEFWQMGGYGFFVWLAFGVSLLALALLIIESTLSKKHLFNLVRSEVARKTRIKAAHSAASTKVEE